MKLCQKLLESDGLPSQVQKRLKEIVKDLEVYGVTPDVIEEVTDLLKERVKEIQSIEGRSVDDIGVDDYLVVLKRAGVPNAVAMTFY